MHTHTDTHTCFSYLMIDDRVENVSTLVNTDDRVEGVSTFVNTAITVVAAWHSTE